MNLVDIYDSLSLPDSENDKTYTAISIPENPGFRIAIGFERYPVLLLDFASNTKEGILKNFRLRYLQLDQNVECRITENGRSIFQTFTVITFKSYDRTLQECFLRFSETLIKSLSNKPTQQQIIDSLNNFVEVFRSLSDTPTNTVHGLWSELFLIENSKDPKALLYYWHSLPEDKFDFNSGVEKIEVKSSSNFQRVHTFSAEQLSPPEDTQVLIASVFIKQHSNGQSIQQLVEKISVEIKDEINLLEKLNGLVIRTLGNTLEQSIKIKFDHNFAKGSLRFYKHQDISKIEKLSIPNKVSEVRYKSDLTEIKPIEISSFNRAGNLFSLV